MVVGLFDPQRLTPKTKPPPRRPPTHHHNHKSPAQTPGQGTPTPTHRQTQRLTEEPLNTEFRKSAGVYGGRIAGRAITCSPAPKRVGLTQGKAADTHSKKIRFYQNAFLCCVRRTRGKRDKSPNGSHQLHLREGRSRAHEARTPELRTKNTGKLSELHRVQWSARYLSKRSFAAWKVSHARDRSCASKRKLRRLIGAGRFATIQKCEVSL